MSTQICGRCKLPKELFHFSVGRAKVKNCIDCRQAAVLRDPLERGRKKRPIPISVEIGSPPKIFRRSGPPPRRHPAIADSSSDDEIYTTIPPPLGTVDFRCDLSDRCDRCQHKPESCHNCQRSHKFVTLRCVHWPDVGMMRECRLCQVVCYHNTEDPYTCNQCHYGYICHHLEYRFACKMCTADTYKCYHNFPMFICDLCYNVKNMEAPFYPISFS